MPLSLLAAAALVLTAFPAAHAADPIYKTFFGDKAIGGYDPVAYHETQSAVEGTKAFSYTWRGANWSFASAANLEKFKADPEKYAPQYGGYCAYAAAKNKLVKSDPKVFDIYEGKLYLNYSKKTQRDWRAEKVMMIEQGNANYPELIAK